MSRRSDPLRGGTAHGISRRLACNGGNLTPGVAFDRVHRRHERARELEAESAPCGRTAPLSRRPRGTRSDVGRFSPLRNGGDLTPLHCAALAWARDSVVATR